jgi:hypothetical protein
MSETVKSAGGKGGGGEVLLIQGEADLIECELVLLIPSRYLFT